MYRSNMEVSTVCMVLACRVQCTLLTRVGLYLDIKRVVRTIVHEKANM
jgi:hypothetical protein